MEIRRATSTDADVVTELFEQYRIFYQCKPDSRLARQFITERLKRQDSLVFIAFVDGKAAGFAQMYPTWSSLSMKPSWILNDLFVVNDFRRQGVASAIVAKCEAFAQESGAVGLSLQTAMDNNSAQALYASGKKS
jgi:ribosomal protein S18 acetylase RimI-like enzyme